MRNQYFNFNVYIISIIDLCFFSIIIAILLLSSTTIYHYYYNFSIAIIVHIYTHILFSARSPPGGISECLLQLLHRP